MYEIADSEILLLTNALLDRLTMHNVHHLLALMGRVRAAIIEDRYPEFLRSYFKTLYGGVIAKIPTWASTALREVGVELIANTRN